MVSELFVEIACWATAQGAAESDPTGIWEGETDEWMVEINRHTAEVDGVPPFTARLTGKGSFHIALVDPMGGVVGGGAREDEMIRHFRDASCKTPGEAPRA